MFTRVRTLATATSLAIERLRPESPERDQKLKETKFWHDNYEFKQRFYEHQLKRIARTTTTVTFFDMAIIATGTLQNGFGAELIFYLKDNGW